MKLTKTVLSTSWKQLSRLVSSITNQFISIPKLFMDPLDKDSKRSIKLSRIPSFINSDALEKTLLENGIQFIGLEKKKKRENAIITFENSQHRDRAVEIISKIEKLAGKTLKKEIKIEDIPFRYVKRHRSLDDLKAPRNLKRVKMEDPDFSIADVRDVITPLWNIPYEEQLQKKEQIAVASLIRIHREIFKTYGKEFTLAYETKYNEKKEIACPLEGILSSPQTDAYRNKVSFTIAPRADSGEDVVVGYQLRRFNEERGYPVILPPDNCRNTPDVSIQLAKRMEEYISTSKYAPWKRNLCEEKPSGVWRRLDVRTTHSKEVMLIVQLDPEGFDSVEDISTEVEKMKEFFLALKDSFGDWTIGTILLQQFSGVSNAAPADLGHEVLYGKGMICDELCDVKFLIQPNSFFQVNRAAAKILFDKVGDWCTSNPNETLLLDVCCGTGTIGLILSKRMKKVIGLEIVPSAIADARANASLNEISNCEFVLGKAEDTIQNVIEENAHFQSIVAVVDPPRCGLHNSVLQQLRSCEKIDQIVYVSCNPASMAVDVLKLVRPEKGKRAGAPFVPVKAVAVDMFPHTEHCEMIVLLKRKKQDL